MPWQVAIPHGGPWTGSSAPGTNRTIILAARRQRPARDILRADRSVPNQRRQGNGQRPRNTTSWQRQHRFEAGTKIIAWNSLPRVRTTAAATSARDPGRGGMARTRTCRGRAATTSGHIDLKSGVAHPDQVVVHCAHLARPPQQALACRSGSTWRASTGAWTCHDLDPTATRLAARWECRALAPPSRRGRSGARGTRSDASVAGRWEHGSSPTPRPHAGAGYRPASAPAEHPPNSSAVRILSLAE